MKRAVIVGALDPQMVGVSAGQLLYDAYVESCGGVSFLGTPLPAWGQQASHIQAHWEHAGLKMFDFLYIGFGAMTVLEQ